MVNMLPNKPYLIRGLYQWIIESECTPYIVVNTNVMGVTVPAEYIKDDRIILNIAPAAIRNLQLGNDLIEFSARFSGVERKIAFPTQAVLAIYAVETGRGMVFEEDTTDQTGSSTGAVISPPNPPAAPPPKGKPKLTIVK